jgi:hypothetical protein
MFLPAYREIPLGHSLSLHPPSSDLFIFHAPVKIGILLARSLLLFWRLRDEWLMVEDSLDQQFDVCKDDLGVAISVDLVCSNSPKAGSETSWNVLRRSLIVIISS